VDLALRAAEVFHEEAKRVGDDQARWAKAVDAARSVERLLADARDEPTRMRVTGLVESVILGAESAQKQQTLLNTLIDIHSEHADDRDGSVASAAYADAFREAAIDVTGLPPAEVGARIRAMPATVAVSLAAALDDWAANRRKGRGGRAEVVRLSQAVRAADLDPWRTGLRDALDRPEKQERLDGLRTVARSADFDALPPVSLDLLGSALLGTDDPQAAERVYREAQHRYPGDLALNYGLAECLRRLARRDEAIRYYTAARAIRPETAHDLAHALVSKGEWAEAIAIFQDLTRLRPDNGRHFLCLGTALRTRHRNEEANVAIDAAIRALRENIRRRPDDAWIHYTLSNALLARGSLDEAIVECRESIRLKPDNESAYTSIASILIGKGKLDEAIVQIREAMRIRSDDYAHALLATVLEKQGKLEEGIAEYRIAVRLQPDAHEHHEHLGEFLIYRGKLDEAMAEFRYAQQIDPSCVNTRRCIGDILRDQGKLNDAIAVYREAIQVDPGDVNSNKGLFWVLKKQGRWEDAIAVYREAARHAPDDPSLLNALTWELLLAPGRPRREYEEALVQARKACQFVPNKFSYANTLALAEYRNGHWAEALVASDRSMAMLNEADTSDFFFHALAMWQKGEKDKARDWFDKAVARTREKDPKNVELLQFWKEAAALLGQPGPGSSKENETE
jgi:eukaryotic-like serine/threonine-protein kinase